MIGFVDLDDTCLRHLLRALERHHDLMRVNGTSMPKPLQEMACRLREGLQGSEVDLAQPVAHVDLVLLLDVHDVATTLGVSVSTVKRLIGSGELPSVTVGSSRRVRINDLSMYVDSLPTGVVA